MPAPHSPLSPLPALLLALLLALVDASSQLLAAPANRADLHFLGPLSTSVTLQVQPPPAAPEPPPEPPPPTPPPPEADSCPATQIWEPTQQRCINPCASYPSMTWHAALQACVRQIDTEHEIESEPCGSANRVISRSRSRTLYRARLPNGHELTLYGPWSPWSEWGSCRPGMPTPKVDEPGGPAPGKRYLLSFLICSSDDEGYDVPPGPDWAKNRVIQYYRSFGTSRRCPEAGGFQHWLDDWHHRAINWVRTNGMWHELALEQVWPQIQLAIDYSATLHREHDPPAGDGGIAAANQLCLQAARNRWPGFSGTVQYLVGSGNTCIVNTL